MTGWGSSTIGKTIGCGFCTIGVITGLGPSIGRMTGWGSSTIGKTIGRGF
ncbi:unnamed protein product, partial [Allacma fusca]